MLVRRNAWRLRPLHREAASLLPLQVLNAVTSTLWLTAPTMAGLASFLVKSQLLHQTITPAEGFTSLTLFQLLSVSLTFLPSVINQAIQANVGLRRISRYLALPDVDGRDAAAAAAAAAQLPRGALRIRNGSFRWKEPPMPTPDATTAEADGAAAGQGEGGATATDAKAKKARGRWLRRRSKKTNKTAPLAAQDASGAAAIHSGNSDDNDAAAAATTTAAAAAAAPRGPTLSGIDLDVAAGELTVVYGPTGCGKSSLLAALLGDCTREAGEAAVRGGISYVPQRAKP